MASKFSSDENRDFDSNLNLNPSIHESVFIANNSTIIGNVEIMKESSVWFNCVIRGDGNIIKIGKRSNIQDGTIVHIDSKKYPTVIGDDVTIGHGAIVHAATLQSEILVGMGSIILDGSTIESKVILGAGSLVPPGAILEEGYVYMGSPCKKIRPMNDNDYEMILESSQNYVEYARKYKAKYDMRISWFGN